MKKALALMLTVGLVFGITLVGATQDTTKVTSVKAAKYDPPVGG